MLIRKGLAVGIILLMLVSTSFLAGAFDDALTDEDRKQSQIDDLFLLYQAFVWGTYENCYKHWPLAFEIWNDYHWSNLTIHVIGYGPYGSNDEDIWMHIEAYQVKSHHHLGIIGPHRCCIFAFSYFGVTVDGVRQ